MNRQTVFDYIKKEYDTLPEYPWRRYDTSAVFRHSDNRKWFALVMEVERKKLGLVGNESIDVINLKLDDMFFRDMVLREGGILPAYHMNKLHWISVLLDGTVQEKRVFELIDLSFMATASAKKKQKMRPPKEWIIPSNPKYFDSVPLRFIEEVFDKVEEILKSNGRISEFEKEYGKIKGRMMITVGEIPDELGVTIEGDKKPTAFEASFDFYDSIIGVALYTDTKEAATGLWVTPQKQGAA